jgi:hypothetical protein
MEIMSDGAKGVGMGRQAVKNIHRLQLYALRS